MTFESKYASPAMERFAAGDEVAMPSRLLTVSKTRTVVVAAFRMRKAEVELVED